MARRRLKEPTLVISGTYNAKMTGMATTTHRRSRDSQKLLMCAEHLDPVVFWAEKDCIAFDPQDLVLAITDNQAALDAMVAGHTNPEVEPAEVHRVEVIFLHRLGTLLSQMAGQAYDTRTGG
jgi:hypothetical protein